MSMPGASMLGMVLRPMIRYLGHAPSVNIANIVLPTEEERAERRALHDKLDEIAAQTQGEAGEGRQTRSMTEAAVLFL